MHYQQGYDNAFWDGTQLVFGDGDGRVFGRFTRPVDVLGHELTHAVTEHTAGLEYAGQSGALNESVSDVFASCLKQRLLGQTARRGRLADRRGHLPARRAGPGAARHGRARHGVRRPGARQGPPGRPYRDYVDTTDDNGGVHLNSGIPNRAFQLAATAIGGTSWEGAGRIWYAALTGGQVGAQTDFAGFAAATVAAAGAHADAVGRPGSRWESRRPPRPPVRRARVRAGVPAAAPRTGCAVRRTGGFAGLAAAGEVDLAGDPRSGEVRSLLARIDRSELRGGRRTRTCSATSSTSAGHRAVVPEQHLTDELRRLAELVLGDGSR